MRKILFIIIFIVLVNSINAQKSEGELNLEFSSWQIMTDDSKYLIQDYGTAPPPRTVIIKNIEDGKIIFSGLYYENINLQGYTIEIVKNYGIYYGGKWSVNANLNEAEINFAKIFLGNNKPPKEWIRIADLKQGNGLGLLIVCQYNFVTKENKIIGGKYIKTM